MFMVLASVVLTLHVTLDGKISVMILNKSVVVLFMGISAVFVVHVVWVSRLILAGVIFKQFYPECFQSSVLGLEFL